MMEERKRPLDASDAMASGGALKRLREDSASGSNGVHDEDDSSPAFKDLEAYRKEAIYRRLLEAQRDMGRADRRARDLQAQVRSLEERSTSFSQSWLTLVTDVEGLLDQSSSRKRALVTALSAFQSADDPAVLQSAMRTASDTIRQILSSSLSGSSGGNLADSTILDRCHHLTEEASVLRQQVTDQRRFLDSAQDELKDAQHKLRLVERQRDRSLAPGVWAVEHPNEPRPEPPSTRPSTSATPAAEEPSTPQPSSSKPEPSSAEGTPVPASQSKQVSALEQEVHDLSALAKTRLTEVGGLREELVVLKQELERIKVQLEQSQTPSAEQVHHSAAYLELQSLVEKTQVELRRTKAEREVDRMENVTLRAAHQSFDRAMQHEYARVTEDLKTMLGARDSDLTRLRTQRDELNAKINEYKARDSVQVTQTQELRALVAIKEHKSARLRAETRRLQLILAAKSGDKETWSKIASFVPSPNADGPETLDVEGSLRQTKDALQTSFEELQARHDALLSSSSVSSDDVRVQNAQLTAQVAELRRLMYLATQAGGDTELTEASVTQVWKDQATLLAKLQAQADAADQTAAELVSDIDALGAKTNAEDRKVEAELTKRAVDLGKLEDKVLRLTAEKAKADNKYFSAMRAKDAVEAEKTLLVREVEKHKVALDKFIEAEKSFANQQVLNEVEVKATREAAEAHKTELAQLKSTLTGIQAREADVRRVLASTEEQIRSLVRADQDSKAEARRAEEHAQSTSHELERLRKAAAAPRRGSAAPSDNAQLEALNSLLRCSSCKERYRNKVITKCMHTFCAQCVDERISTRQRKCPHCGLSFASSDVQPLYLQ